MRSAALLALCATAAVADKQSLDCPLRQLMVDYAQQLQPTRPLSVFQQLADALNGAQEAQGCTVSPKTARSPLASYAPPATAMPSFPLPPAGAHVVFVDPSRGSDGGLGSEAAPLRTLAAALAAVRSARAARGLAAPAAPPAYLVLRAGTFYPRTLNLTREDSRVTFQAYPGETVFLSGGVPIAGVAWAPAALPARPAWEMRAGSLADGFDVLPAQVMTPAAAQALCEATPACAAVAYAGPAAPAAPVNVSFKYRGYYSKDSSGAAWFLNRGLLPGAANLWAADVSEYAGLGDIAALRVGGVRAILARYPNAVNAEDLDAMQLVADKWIAQSMPKTADYTFAPALPFRNDSTADGHGVGYFQHFVLGVGGPCAQRFTPQASYWCANYSQGGGPGPYSAPVGVVFSNAPESLPHSPYSGDVSRAAVHSWRAGRWFSWVFAVNSSSVAGNTTTLNFSLERGGNQGSRGGDAGQEFFIEGIMDELDAPGEFYYDATAKKLYLFHNASGSPEASSVVAPVDTVIINAVGTQAAPIEGVAFKGIGFRDAAPNYLGPHGTPSGGDWAVGRSGAVFVEGAVGFSLDGCLLTSLDGNAVFFSGYNRNASVTNSEFLGIGETAITQWGYTDGSPVPGMGFDATAGNQPRGTYVGYNVVHEVGLYTKQNSFYFQSSSFGNVIEGNIAYNGPRAGVNFDDGMGGGSVLTKNVLANFCRESSDHGPFNSWNRVPYIWDGPDGASTTQKLNETISYNFILANYHSSMAIDNDDGSSFYDTHHNILWSASSGAAYGGNSLKTDFGGHANYHHDNLDLFWSSGFGICPALPAYEDGYYRNTLYLAKDGNYGGGQNCNPGGTAVYGNTIWSPTGAITECGKTLAEYQAAGGDPGTTAAAYPDDSVVLGVAKALLSIN